MRITELAVPEDINDYLLGIGDVTDYNGVPWTLRLDVELDATLVNGLSGNYGKINAANHIHYETLPSPFQAVYQGSGAPMAYAVASSNITSAAVLFRYRLDRVYRDHTDSLCYTLPGGVALPGLMTANTVFTSCPQWNTGYYREMERYSDDVTLAYCLGVRATRPE
uniref:Uncharacterized protein n=1 Tax=Anopheles culicifacies TaxID=139723 RepID=A0A182M155_9DIPT